MARLIEFGRFAARNRADAGRRRPETFDFLGFTHYCGKTRTNRFTVKRKTQAKRLVRKLKAIRDEMQRRMHARGGPELALGREEPVGARPAEAHDRPRSKAQ
jgi:hypothetical protein